jgi:hypothetical protein
MIRTVSTPRRLAASAMLLAVTAIALGVSACTPPGGGSGPPTTFDPGDATTLPGPH